MMNSFVMYVSYADQINMLTMEQRGKLLTDIMDYASDSEVNESDPLVNMAFSFIRSKMDSDFQKYENTCRKRSDAGKQGGRPKAEVKEAKIIQDKPAKNADKVNALNADCDAVIDYLNTKAHRKFSHSDTSRRHVRARLADGFSVDDCKAVIDKKCAEWSNDSRMQEYLRPETLFGSKFEGYLNQKAKAGNVLPAWAVPVEDREDTDLIKEFMKDHGE